MSSVFTDSERVHTSKSCSQSRQKSAWDLHASSEWGLGGGRVGPPTHALCEVPAPPRRRWPRTDARTRRSGTSGVATDGVAVDFVSFDRVTWWGGRDTVPRFSQWRSKASASHPRSPPSPRGWRPQEAHLLGRRAALTASATAGGPRGRAGRGRSPPVALRRLTLRFVFQTRGFDFWPAQAFREKVSTDSGLTHASTSFNA